MEHLVDAATMISLIDLTSLNDSDTPESTQRLCGQAANPIAAPAAVCIYPRFITSADTTLRRQGTRKVTKVATVTNFPFGTDDFARVADETCEAIALGADEIDVVLPWRDLKQGNEARARKVVRASRDACPGRILKVIIESGELGDPVLIRQASLLAIEEGADFIKTSTGKTPISATLDAAHVMLTAIANHNPGCGFKASGGIKSLGEARAYLELASQLMGADWISPNRFRFGASSLLSDLLAQPAMSTVNGY